jgi:uncharacterized protein (DUF433 family)
MGQTVELMERITVNLEQCGGRACVRGLRIRVIDVLDLLAAGLTAEQLVEELPDLEPADVMACLRSPAASSTTLPTRLEGAGGEHLHPPRRRGRPAPDHRLLRGCPMTSAFRELDTVVLVRDVPEVGLRAGDLDAVV